MNYSCTHEGCQVATTGKCLEGFDPPDTCPYLPTTTISSPDTASSGLPAFVDLPSGEALTETQASEVTRQSLTRVVVLAGPSASGKTTILTSLFESLLEAPFGSFLFAGSRTMVGFERRCHDARTTSGRQIPHTGKTTTDTIDFLHLRLASATGGLRTPQSVLLSDISGERFRRLRDSTKAVQEMPMLRRADDLCIVIDGEKLADPTRRHSARNDARMLLRSLIEGRALSASCRIEVVFSKWDLLLAGAGQEPLVSLISETKKTLQETAKNVGTLQFFEIAARPTNSSLPFAFGLPTLLRYWLKEPSGPVRTRLYVPAADKNVREATRFGKSVVEIERLEEFYDVQWV
jgi:hypothetical protein